MANVCEPVAGAHRHVPQPVTHRPATVASFSDHDGALHPTGLCPWAATAVPAGPSCASSGLGTMERRGLGPAVARELLQHHGATAARNSVNDWVADSGASHHTTHSVSNIFNPRPLNSASPSSIVVGNGSTLPVTLAGDSVIHGSFYLNNILLAPNIVQNLFSVHHFTTDNWCSMELDPFSLSVKDLTTRNVIARSNSTGPLYTLRLPSFTASSRTSPCDMSTIALPRILAVVATSTWHRRLGHPGPDALSSLCLGHHLFPALVLLMIFVMLVSWANTPDCLYPVHRVMQKRHLIYYILIFGYLRLLVCLVQNTTWSFLMISLIICGLFH
jgi:hypothetical protein